MPDSSVSPLFPRFRASPLKGLHTSIPAGGRSNSAFHDAEHRSAAPPVPMASEKQATKRPLAQRAARLAGFLDPAHEVLRWRAARSRDALGFTVSTP